MTRVKKQRKKKSRRKKEKNIYIDRFFSVQNDADCRVPTNDPQPCITNLYQKKSTLKILFDY